MRSCRLLPVGAGGIAGPAGMRRSLRRFQKRMRSATPNVARIRTAKGTIQATSSKPPRMGAERTMGPYFPMKKLRTPASGRAEAIWAWSSAMMTGEAGQPTWLQSSRIWLQPHWQTSLWPSLSYRASGLDAPSMVTATITMARVWKRRLGMGAPSGRVDRSFGAAGGGQERWSERDRGAQDDDEDADPYPVDQRVEEDLDNGAVGFGVAAHEDGVEVARQSGVDCDDRQRGL